VCQGRQPHSIILHSAPPVNPDIDLQLQLPNATEPVKLVGNFIPQLTAAACAEVLVLQPATPPTGRAAPPLLLRDVRLYLRDFNPQEFQGPAEASSVFGYFSLFLTA
jgi:hypothetical protein